MDTEQIEGYRLGGIRKIFLIPLLKFIFEIL